MGCELVSTLNPRTENPASKQRHPGKQELAAPKRQQFAKGDMKKALKLQKKINHFSYVLQWGGYGHPSPPCAPPDTRRGLNSART
ncbi:hypothetical protein DIPPA_24953 [Diplonema papillatum]|nr:hypothetical protein DIPPA_24953 [Diplonema papillatum]